MTWPPPKSTIFTLFLSALIFMSGGLLYAQTPESTSKKTVHLKSIKKGGNGWVNRKNSHKLGVIRRMNGLLNRLGLPQDRMKRVGGQYIIQLLKGDSVKLSIDDTVSHWTSIDDGAITLIANPNGIHTIVADRKTNDLFKTSFATGQYFIVTPNPWKLGVLSFKSTNEPNMVYLPKAGTRYIQPWAKLPYTGGNLSVKQMEELLRQTKLLAIRLGLDNDQYDMSIVEGQAVVSLRKSASFRLNPGITYEALHDGDIKFFVDLHTAEKGFHTLQIKRSSLTEMTIPEDGEFIIWSYNKKKTFLTYYAIQAPKSVYTPLDYAEDLFEPFEPKT